MLNQVADGVWVRQSEWVLSNAIARRGEGGLILVDPGIDGSDLNQLADDLDRLDKNDFKNLGTVRKEYLLCLPKICLVGVESHASWQACL